MPKTKPFKPTAEQLKAAAGKAVPDLIAPGLKVLFVGINPGLYSAAVGHHFARPGNRFWPALLAGGFTSRVLSPWDERELLDDGYGITNVVDRATAGAAELTPAEFVAGGRRLVQKVRRFKPRLVAFLGVTSYRVAFERPRTAVGQQQEMIGSSRVWVLPNPSGLNAHYTPRQLGKLFGEMRLVTERDGR